MFKKKKKRMTVFIVLVVPCSVSTRVNVLVPTVFLREAFPENPIYT